MTIRPIGRDVLMACRFQLGTAHQLRRMPGRSSTSRRTLLGWLKPNVHDSDTPISRDNSGGSSSSSQASGSRSPETDDGNTSARILESRLSQDPHNRIRVLKPFMPYSVKKGRWSIMPLTASISDFSGWNNSNLDEAHCLPFWTMVYITTYQRKSLDKISGVTDAGYNLDIMDMGFSVCAVGDDHWASGLVLTDDARELLDTEFGMQDIFGVQSPDHYKEWAAGNAYSERSVPPFAKGYPKLTEDQLMDAFRRIAEDQSTRTGGEDHLRWLVEMREPVRTLAIPTYRPVYKKNFQDGSTGYWDGWRSPDRSQTISGHHFKLPKGRPKSNLKGMEVDPQLNFRFWDHGKWVKELTVEQRDSIDEVAAYVMAGFPTSHKKYVESVVRALDTSVLDWDDPNILSADIGPGPNLQAIIKYATQHILRFDGGRLPQAFKRAPKPVQSAPSVLRRSILKRSTPTSTRTAGSTSSTQSSTPSASSFGPRSKPVPPSAARPPPPRPPSSRVMPRSPSLTEPVEPEYIMVDPKGYYAALDITPTKDFFSLTARTTVLKRLNEAKRTMQMVHHPDKQRSRPVMQDPMAAGRSNNIAESRSLKVNMAYDRLKSVNMRREYQGISRLQQEEADL